MEREHGRRSGRCGRHHDRQSAGQLVGDSRLVIDRGFKFQIFQVFEVFVENFVSDDVLASRSVSEDVYYVLVNFFSS